jgi:hypothetical protein
MGILCQIVPSTLDNRPTASAGKRAIGNQPVEQASRRCTENDVSDKPPAPDLVIPNGYRQGLITSITVILAFSLAFLRFAAFEPASGPWTFGA